PLVRQLFAMPGVTDYWEFVSENDRRGPYFEGLVPLTDVLQFFQTVDIDVFKDVERLIIGGKADDDYSAWPVIVQGTFDTARISALAEENPELLQKAVGREFDIWEWYPADSPMPSLYVVLLSAGTLVLVSTRETIDDLLDRVKGDDDSPGS